MVQRLRVALWPRRNHSRSSRYVMKRVMRIRGTPHAIALGVAVGAFASFTPLMGFHFLLSFLIAFLVGGSMISAALGTAVGNPLTFPAIWAATLGTGRLILGIQSDPAQASFGQALQEQGFVALWEPFVLPMMVGSVPLGLLVGGIFYVITRTGVAAFQRRRAERREMAARGQQTGDEPGSGVTT